MYTALEEYKSREEYRSRIEGLKKELESAKTVIDFARKFVEEPNVSTRKNLKTAVLAYDDDDRIY